MEDGNSAQYKGQNIDEIDINLDEDLLAEPSDQQQMHTNEMNVEPINEFVNYDTQLSEEKDTLKDTIKDSPKVDIPAKKKKRELVRWTEEQKVVVKEFFKTHIAEKRPPKRNECEILIEQHIKLLENKDWLKIKVFVQNLYTNKYAKK